MKNLFSFLLLLITCSFYSCDKTSFDAEWSLIQIENGFGQQVTTIPENQIQWSFNEEDGTISIHNETADKSLPTGMYDYELEELEEPQEPTDPSEFVQNININGQFYGRYIEKNDTLIITSNIMDGDTEIFIKK